MPAYIRARTVSDGRRFDVIYRQGGRYTKVQHAGTFKTRREAELRKRTVEDWLARALNPKVELARLVDDDLTVEQAAVAWLRSRRSINNSTRALYQGRVDRLARDFAGVQARHLTVADVNGWVDRLELAPSTVREYLLTLRAVLDHAGVENVVRDRRVERPRNPRRLLEPPGAEVTLRALAKVPARYRPVLVLVEQTGLRVSEACAVQPEHLSDGRLLVPVTKTGRPRWVPAPDWLTEKLEPPWGVSRQRTHNALKAACEHAGVRPFGPHMLRHRRASLWSAQGVAPAQAAAWLGHSVKTYLDTYTWVIPVDEIDAHRLAALL